MRRVLYVGVVVLIPVLSACEKEPVSTNKDMPLKTSEGVDKKGRKTKAMEASFEEPPKEKK